MKIIINNASGRPIYEQITSQIKNLILNQNLKPGDALPSMRLLAKELRISVITTKRAYEDLEREGWIETRTGKGSFIAEKDLESIKEANRKLAKQQFQKAIQMAESSGIPKEELIKLILERYKGDI